ncbi:twin-arginine translocation signal domain-containing protein [bacterium]|nr:twin-arginine translocation signal domain-containing protein [bacterium]
MNEHEHSNHGGCCHVSRRSFMKKTAGAAVLGAALLSQTKKVKGAPRPGWQPSVIGPGGRYVPKINVAFVRRKSDYGMSWPGAIYDGEAAQKRYIHQIETTAKELGVSVDMRSAPIYSLEEGEQWIKEAQGQRADGLFLVVHDRQQHSWPTAHNAINSGIPTVIFSPVGTSFTVNTGPADALNKGLICSTDDFSQALYGMKMLKAGAKLRETKVVVLKGEERRNDEVKHFGTKLIYVPAGDFLDEYNRIPMTGEIKQMADEYIRDATQMMGTTKQDVLNGIKSYTVARNILEREKADAITMDCLGALGKSKISLPCIS